MRQFLFCNRDRFAEAQQEVNAATWVSNEFGQCALCFSRKVIAHDIGIAGRLLSDLRRFVVYSELISSHLSTSNLSDWWSERRQSEAG